MPKLGDIADESIVTFPEGLPGLDDCKRFVILRPERSGSRFHPERHLDMMKWISTLGREGDFRRFALGVANRTELVDLLTEKSEL